MCSLKNALCSAFGFHQKLNLDQMCGFLAYCIPVYCIYFQQHRSLTFLKHLFVLFLYINFNSLCISGYIHTNQLISESQNICFSSAVEVKPLSVRWGCVCSGFICRQKYLKLKTIHIIKISMIIFNTAQKELFKNFSFSRQYFYIVLCWVFFSDKKIFHSLTDCKYMRFFPA